MQKWSRRKKNIPVILLPYFTQPARPGICQLTVGCVRPKAENGPTMQPTHGSDTADISTNLLINRLQPADKEVKGGHFGDLWLPLKTWTQLHSCLQGHPGEQSMWQPCPCTRRGWGTATQLQVLWPLACRVSAVKRANLTKQPCDCLIQGPLESLRAWS